MNNNFSFHIGDTFAHETIGYTIDNIRGATYWHYGFSQPELLLILATTDLNTIGDILAEVTSDLFGLFIYDPSNKSFMCFNDRSGHNEIYISCNPKENSYSVTNDIFGHTELDEDAVHEYLIFHSVLPPNTMYKGVETVPMGSSVAIPSTSEKLTYQRYWNVEKAFKPKTNDYHTLVRDLQDSCVREVKKRYTPKSGVALSGGIDSGGILGMLHELSNKPVPTISFGPHGPGSNDLESARKTADHFSSVQTELYPSDDSFEYLFSVLPKLNHPIPADILLPLCHIFDEAKTRNIDTLFFGYGVQANLGNLMFNKMWHWLWIFELLPKPIRNSVYTTFANLKGFSENQKAILLSDSWVERFLFNQGALYTREKQIYKKMDGSFFEKMKAIYQPIIEHTELKLSDRFVLMYILGWTHHTQERDTPMIAKQFGVNYFCPYNSKEPIELLLKASDTIRKRNRWKKQVWRDALRSFIPQHLYTRKGKSLVVPYSKIFKDELDRFLPYLESHTMLSQYVDFDLYKGQFHSLPEPGLNLIRLVSFGIWYDARHDPKHLEVIKMIFGEKEKASSD